MHTCLIAVKDLDTI